MAKTWVLETHTKGTGANIVPLEEGVPAPAAEPREREPLLVPRRPAPRPAPAPAAKAPSRFRVVEVTTGRVLAEDAGVRATVELLRDVPSIVDVAIWTWSAKHGRYVLLTHREQRRLWELRDAVRPAAAP